MTPGESRVLQYMKNHGSINTKQANIELGETRLSARIYELKKQGCNIDSYYTRVTNRYNEESNVKIYYLK